MLVEDDADVRKIMHAFLVALGCVVTAAADAERALATLRGDARFDILLSDVVLGPGMRGTELAVLAQQRDPGLAVLLMSGFAAELLQADEMGHWELLRKPCTRDELAAALARSLAAAS